MKKRTLCDAHAAPVTKLFDPWSWQTSGEGGEGGRHRHATDVEVWENSSTPRQDGVWRRGQGSKKKTLKRGRRRLDTYGQQEMIGSSKGCIPMRRAAEVFLSRNSTWYHSGLSQVHSIDLTYGCKIFRTFRLFVFLLLFFSSTLVFMVVTPPCFRY